MGVALVVWSLIFFRSATALVTWQSDSIAMSMATSSDTFTLHLQASRFGIIEFRAVFVTQEFGLRPGLGHT